jgi:hypothetical protein
MTGIVPKALISNSLWEYHSGEQNSDGPHA